MLKTAPTDNKLNVLDIPPQRIRQFLLSHDIEANKDRNIMYEQAIAKINEIFTSELTNQDQLLEQLGPYLFDWYLNSK